MSPCRVRGVACQQGHPRSAALECGHVATEFGGNPNLDDEPVGAFRAHWEAWVVRELETKFDADTTVVQAPDKRRSAANKAADAAAVRAIAQAAVNVELFTIPLYMVALYSIQGMHQITAEGNDFYADRLWPGAATTADPQTANERAFNLIFSVFVEEMLHLQIAANVASAIGVIPVFTSPLLQDAQYGWTCYGPDKTVIPHVIDLADTTHDDSLRVNLGALSPALVALLMAIEEPAVRAHTSITDAARDKYFPSVPFDGWTEHKTEVDLPMFGTIDHLYQCYLNYLSLQYDDGTTLWDHVFTSGSQQNDMFNVESPPGHPKREYPGFEATVKATDKATAFNQVVAMLNAITDQGEGSLLSMRFGDPTEVVDVKSTYEPTPGALEADYPYYTDQGELAPSADTVARTEHARLDHYARFAALMELIGAVETWPQWHQRHGEWTAADLQTSNVIVDTYNLPAPQDIADAYNRLAAPDNRDAAYALISRAAVGSLAGIGMVLNEYWAAPGVVFPYPAMTGSADRMGTCWALFGVPPDLSMSMAQASVDQLYHACQGLDLFDAANHGCAPIENYHSCKGSNFCGARGGCGFVHPAGEATPGAQCGFALVKAKRTGDDHGLFSAPSDNRCATMGGCAVPISAAQAFPQGGTMELVDFVGEDSTTPEVFDRMSFDKGELVHDVAYRAYLAVMKRRHPDVQLPEQSPAPSDVRLVFPPST